nr:xylulose kinase-1 [Tanacetum cinerariifolium]
MANFECCDTHNMVAYLQKPVRSEEFHQIVDFLNTSQIRYALTENPNIYVSLIQQFWQTATSRTLDNGEMEITATIDGKVKVVTEASVRRHLELEDSDGISILPTTEIFEQLALMGVKDQQSRLSPITHSQVLHQPHNYIFHHHLGVLSDRKLSGNVPSMPHDSPLPRVNTLGSNEGSMTLQELTVLCTTLSQKVESLEADLKQTKQVYGAAYTKLIIKVKELEKTVKTSKARRKAKNREAHTQEDRPKDQLGVLSAAKILADTAKRNVQTYTGRRAVSTGSRGVSTTSRMINTAEESISTVGASMPVSTAGMIDKGKGIMEESELDVTKTKRQQKQERLGLETAVRLQEQFDEEDRQRIARVHEAAQSFTEEEWENIKSRVEVDEELTQRLQAEERNKYSEVDQAKMPVDLINKRKRYFAEQKAKEERKKPMTQAQQRTYMSNDLFEATMRSIKDFVLMESKDDNAVPKLAEARSLKRDAEEELDQGRSKKQKIGESSEPRNKDVDELSQEELQQLIIIVLEQGMNVEALQTKYTIIDREIYTEDTRKYWNIIRVGNYTEVYQFFDDMLKGFDKDDLVSYGFWLKKDSVQQNLPMTKKEYYGLI